MSQQLRSILAVALSFLFIALYYSVINPPKPATPQAGPSEPVTTSSTPNPSSPNPVPQPQTLPPLPEEAPLSLKEPIPFTTSKVSGTIAVDSASINAWSLKDYHHGSSTETPLINITENGGQAFYTTLGYSTYGSTFSEKNLPIDQNIIGRTPWYLVSQSSQEGLTSFLFGRKSDFLEVFKKIDLQDTHPYIAEVTLDITNTGNQPLTLDPRLWISINQKKEEKKTGLLSFIHPQPNDWYPLHLKNDSLTSNENLHKLAKKVIVNGNFYWTGISDRYFLSSLISRQESDKTTIEYGKTDTQIYTSLSYGPVTLQPGEKIERKFSAYIGPKKRDDLAKLNLHLEKSVDYGWIAWIAVPILNLLFFFHKIIGNWGLAIIALTFFIKLLLHPVNKKAMNSMKEMQKIQPELQSIREKFANDKEKLNMEMMNLFKRHKVNPAGGCLPMILQMPIYIALYKVLYNAIELYHAPFFGFYKDLSAPDPYLIAPIILGIFMFLQQKFTPNTSMDPAQKNMMMVMPMIFSVFMIFLPVGLVLYILVNTVMSVIQQYMIQHDLSGLDLFKKVFRRA